MKYRKIKPILIDINTLVTECGMFKDTQEEPYSCGQRGPQSCSMLDCPIAYAAMLEDLKEHDMDLYNEYKDEEFDPSEMGAGWMVQYLEPSA